MSVSRLKFEYVDRLPGFEQFVESAVQAAGDVQERRAPDLPPLLRDVQPLLSRYWLPDYLPAGFSKESAVVHGLERIYPDILFPHSEVKGSLMIAANPAEHHPLERLAPGSHSPIAHLTHPAHLVRGGWLVSLDEEGEVHFAGWEAEHTTRLLLEIAQPASVVALELRPGDLISQEELFKIADSLTFSRPSRRLWLPFLRR